jgi:hypothetical protein
MATVKVTDRHSADMLAGMEFERWPDDNGTVPVAGTIVTVFDKDLSFTRHRVVDSDPESRRVEMGPAIPWRAESG